MVDNSELPFPLLCRKYGAEAAYTPTLHSRIFSRKFTTCKVPTAYCQKRNNGAFLMDKLPLVKTGDWVLDGEDGVRDGQLDQADLFEYLKLCEKYPVPYSCSCSQDVRGVV
ncbi:hypothetical protein L1987_44210 [Smallanthus sonchifolius]|uniref:Uncharacterized protein n=1 Tax=Smallanthus sonchifolius TaxID=185202 RepID=A0ACB9GPJ7_9ASTR|nr:hypothetical protein L1987_44210 [Smallanthus sonchifolius]